MKFQFLIVFLLAQSSSAFVPAATQSKSVATSTSSSLDAVPVPSEVSAQQLTNYMARSHEEKLKALKTLEVQKNKEIQDLKEKIQNAGSGIVQASSVPTPTPASGSVAELSKKLAAYQKFMATYVVKAQEDKARAVREAEIAIAKKYEAKLQALMLPPSGGGSSSSTSVQMNEAFVQRSEKVTAAAKAGKSRWGDQEIERAAGVSINVPKQTISAAPAAASSVPTTGEIPSEVIAADHGLRADGGVGGWTLAERVANGANGVTISNGATAPGTVVPNASYLARNAYIAAAAKAGKQGRWGSMEETRSIEYKPSALPAAPEVIVIPEVAAADHGLRADGGVGGPTLAQRVNLGARLLQ